MSETSTALKQVTGDKEQLQTSEGNSTDVSRKPSFSFDDRPHDRNIARHTRSSWIPSIYLGSGIIRDIRARAPYYASDWKDAWNYRVIPAIVLIFFAKFVSPLRHHSRQGFIVPHRVTRYRVLTRLDRDDTAIRGLRSVGIVVHGRLHLLRRHRLP